MFPSVLRLATSGLLVVWCACDQDAPGLVLPHPQAPGVELLADCSMLANAEQVCVRSEYGGRLLGFDPSSLNTACAIDAFVPDHTSSLAWIKDEVYACADEHLFQISLKDGHIAARPEFCASAASAGDDLVISGGAHPIARYSRWEDYPARPTRVYEDWLTVSRVAVIGSIYYGAWHATAEIERLDLEIGEVLPPLPLGGSDWNFGLGALPDRLLLVRPSPTGGVEARDPETGALIESAPVAWADRNQAVVCGGRIPSRPLPPVISDPVTAVGDCELSAYDSGDRREEELHVVGVYETTDGTGLIQVNRAGKVDLVVVAATESAWTIVASPTTQLQSVRVLGAKPGAVVAPAGVPVSIEVGEDRPPSVLSIGYNYDSFAGRLMVESLAELYGRPVRSFNGCYRGSVFELR